MDTQQQGCITFWTKNSNKHDQVLLTTVPDLKYLKVNFGVKNLHLHPPFSHYYQARIDFNNTNTNWPVWMYFLIIPEDGFADTSLGMDFLIHS